MSTVKFKLVPNPTFDHPVQIPMPGEQPASVKFTFKHRDRDAFKLFIDQLKDLDDEAIFKEIVVGWGLSDEFNDENIDRLIKNYHGAARAILDEYINEQGALRNLALGK